MKIKLTKTELKRQREALAQFIRYLPMLQLKKQQLQFEIERVDRAIEVLIKEIDDKEREIFEWVDLFAEDTNLGDILKKWSIVIERGNVAGIDIPVFVDVRFEEIDYDLLRTPLWVDYGLRACKGMITLKARLSLLDEQRIILEEELRIATQRVNLFEKIKIPQAKEIIRVIRIYLGDLQTAEVVRGKIAKAKIAKQPTVSGEPA